MPLNLLDSFGSKGVSLGLYTKHADVLDTEYLSRYFVVSEFNPTLTAGKNSISFNGSTYLKGGSEILIECLDSKGNPLFIEMAKYSDNSITYAYKESTAFVFSIYVYNDTSDGVGKLILYGTLFDGRSVKWTQNVTVNKTLRNTSRTRFYQTPILEVESAEVPVLSSAVSMVLVDNPTFTGKIHSLALSPPKDTNLSTVNKRNIDIDYRLTLTSPIVDNNTSDTGSFNSQMIGATINLNINKIQLPLFTTEIFISETASYVISDVINNNTLKISTPYFYKDGKGNETVTNITDADFSINYPFINYNNESSSYETSTIGNVTYIIKESFADITYKNIRTFSGYVTRHKVYRKSLLSNADFSIIADEPVVINEILNDDLTQNKFYELLGKFYNNEHISRYWFTSSNNISLAHSPSFAIDSMFISSPSFSSLSGNDYFMVKNDSVPVNRNANYVPFNMDEFLSESGSAYDSNFMALKANVQYIIEISAVILKNPDEINAGLSFYFTSSIPSAQKEPSFTKNFGIRVANITTNKKNASTVNFENSIAFFTPQNDLYGTLVVIPQFCEAYIKNISFRVYGDDGFSPDVFTTRIPWSISVANDSFAIKAELFDIDSNLIYSNLSSFKSFDPSGSSLIPFFPSGSSSQDLHVSGSLFVSHNVVIQENLFIPNIPARTPGIPISQSRLLSVRADGAIVFDPIVDVSCDTEYIYLSTGSATNRLATPVLTRKSLASEYGSLAGTKIYWVGDTKHTETIP